jgi:uncharacterized protein YdaU (DUF1376 family)
MHYYTFNIGDYRKDTGHLSTLEHGIYRQLLEWYYLDEKPIPQETQTVIRRLRLGSDSDIAALKSVLSDFFVLQEDGYHQAHCDAAIAKYHSKAEVNKTNGKLGGRPKKTQTVISGNPEQSDSKGNQEPITNNHKPNKENTPPRKRVDLVCPDSVDQQVWSDFVQHRKAKRSAITQTALEGIQREAAKAGWTLEQALRETVARGWTGFKADWVNSNEQKQAKSFAQQERELGWKRWEEMTGRQHPDRLASEGISQGQVIDVSGNFLEIEQ